MLVLPPPANIARRYIVRRIQKRRRGLLARQDSVEGSGIPRITDEQAMVAECDEVTGPENRRAIEDGRGNCIIWICTAIFKVRDDLINFGDLEASIFDREPRLVQQHSQFRNLL